jgi:hypothetical protein
MAPKRKSQYAAALGRQGGRKGGPARAASMTPEQRSESARNAVMARWKKAKGQSYSTDLQKKFRALVRDWQRERGAMSSITEMAMLPSYQKIIGMGEAAVPLLISQLKSEGNEPDQWFWALMAITDANPVDAKDQGNFANMAQSWIKWAENVGYAI